MTPGNITDHHRAVKLAALYNIVPNVVWSVVCLTPVVVFCYTLLPAYYLYGFITISILVLAVPQSILKHLQLSKRASFYKNAGVPFIQKFTQNGVIINTLIRKKYPTYRVYVASQASQYRSTSLMFLKFHLAMFVFFSALAVYAFADRFAGWGLVILISNMVYNVYPILLQHYNQLRLSNFTQRIARSPEL